MKSWDELKFFRNDVDAAFFDKSYGTSYLPPANVIYKALDLCPPDKVKVVILGQDPYPTKGHANGLAFSVHPHVKPLPRSLANIFCEYENDLGYRAPSTGDLTTWAQRGVLLLNTILTVEEGKPLSHANIGWEKLTYEIISRLSAMHNRGIVFILWGNKAQEYRGLIDEKEHKVLASSHPSPLSARNGFFGSKPFSQANTYMKSVGQSPVDWKLP